MIKAEGVEKSYGRGDGKTKVLNGIDLTIEEGEFAVILGASGSGKSTLLGVLSGLERPDAGKVFCNGEELTAMTERELADFRTRTFGRGTATRCDCACACKTPARALFGRTDGRARRKYGAERARLSLTVAKGAKVYGGDGNAQRKRCGNGGYRDQNEQRQNYGNNTQLLPQGRVRNRVVTYDGKLEGRI